MSVAVSLTAPQFSERLDPVLEAAQTVEAMGLDGLFLFDHLVPLGDEHRPVLELAATLGAVAAATRRINVGTLVMRAPLRGPDVSAAVARTAAAIAPGRLILGLGVGDSMSAEEARRYGQQVPSLSERIEAVRSTLEATRSLGVQRWVGGVHRRLIDLVGEADGWNAWASPVDEVSTIADRVRARCQNVTVSWGGSVVMGRDGNDLDQLLAERSGRLATVNGTARDVVSELRRLISVGVDHLIISVLPNRRDRWEAFADAVRGRLG